MKRKVLLTNADVLEHSYGTPASVPEDKPVVSPTLPSPPPPPPAPPPPPPPPPAPPSTPAVSVEEVEVESEVPEAEPDTASIFIEKYTKAELIKIAQDAGIDAIGNKAQLAQRLVEAGIAPDK